MTGWPRLVSTWGRSVDYGQYLCTLFANGHGNPTATVTYSNRTSNRFIVNGWFVLIPIRCVTVLVQYMSIYFIHIYYISKDNKNNMDINRVWFTLILIGLRMLEYYLSGKRIRCDTRPDPHYTVSYHTVYPLKCTILMWATNVSFVYYPLNLGWVSYHFSRDGYEIRRSEFSECPDIQIRIWIKFLSRFDGVFGQSGFMDFHFIWLMVIFDF